MTTSTPKPGVKTTEFWITVLVSVLTSLVGLGVIDVSEGSDLDQIVGLVAPVLVALGYNISRGKAKSG